MTINETELNVLTAQLATELAGAWGVVSVHLGVRQGLYRALSAGPASAGELAGRTGTNERLLQEWLVGQSLAGYITADPDGRYSLSPEQGMVLAVEESPAYLGGLTEVLAATVQGQQRIDAAFSSDGALAWGDQNPGLFDGFDRSFGPVYRACLFSQWLPALSGIESKLAAGASVADIGAGHATALTLMAAEYPASRFVAVDLHQGSLDAAAKKAAAEGVAGRIRMESASGAEYGGGPYDLITFFDSLHDMGDPERVIAHAARQVAEDGSVMVVEPMTAEGPDDAAGLFAARLFYPSSAMLCTPSALAGGTTALGNQVPDETWAYLFHRNGFTSFRRVAQTPFNRVFEARR
ncbi:class I SAM-dependent methyltransferase [Arthrobacter zhaoguopingii]|uniref:class I SAM-dependent methyltransferase n=1 Tax=Arthrobacter zhaoguopingii TaxID=2681491 RepID=UPI001359333A|nr:class I SAM-dependent methyltransferase [Arthrobacter zhaoguopingii]